MSKKLLAAVAAASSLVTVGALMLASAWWEHSDWPSEPYLVHLKDSPKTALQCEVLATFMHGSRILATFNAKEGHNAGCYLFVTGQPQPDGSFVVYPRPSNPLSVREWLQFPPKGPGMRTIKTADLDGICRENGDDGVTSAKAAPACMRLKSFMAAAQRPQGL